MSEWTIEGDETMRWDVIASPPKEEPKQDWLVVVPVKDSQGRIVDWRPKMVVPSASLKVALAIAREDYGSEADVRPR